MEKLSTVELKKQWQDVFRKEPPSYASRDFMLGHILWVQQATEHGGLKRTANSQMKRLTKQLREGVDLTPEHTLTIKPGTKLLREYQGGKYEVIATEDGFRYLGKTYGSLSMIARRITGTRWNGKVFFGVK